MQTRKVDVWFPNHSKAPLPALCGSNSTCHEWMNQRLATHNRHPMCKNENQVLEKKL
jgi:hypothetical protein